MGIVRSGRQRLLQRRGQRRPILLIIVRGGHGAAVETNVPEDGALPCGHAVRQGRGRGGRLRQSQWQSKDLRIGGRRRRWCGMWRLYHILLFTNSSWRYFHRRRCVPKDLMTQEAIEVLRTLRRRHHRVIARMRGAAVRTLGNVRQKRRRYTRIVQQRRVRRQSDAEGQIGGVVALRCGRNRARHRLNHGNARLPTRLWM